MNFCFYLIITLFGIAGSTSAYEGFEDNYSIRAEVKVYCKSPSEYEQSDGGEKYGPIGGWNVSAVTSMKGLFKGFSTCNPPISNWDVGAVKTFKNMFKRADAFDQDVSAWDVGNGRSFERMFNRAAAFNQDLSGWDVGNGRSFERMFYEAAAFNQDLSGWDVAKCQTFYGMFYEAAAFNQDLSGWNVGKGQSFRYMFKNSGMNHFIGDWNFKSMEKSVGSLGIFFSMFGATKCNDLLTDEWEQLNNFVDTRTKND